MAAVYATASNQVAALKELYTGDDYMKDLVYKKNPFLALVPKAEVSAVSTVVEALTLLKYVEKSNSSTNTLMFFPCLNVGIISPQLVFDVECRPVQNHRHQHLRL